MSIIADSSFAFCVLAVAVVAGWENVSASDSAFATLDRRLWPAAAPPRVDDRLRCFEGEGEAPFFVGDCEMTGGGGSWRCKPSEALD